MNTSKCRNILLKCQGRVWDLSTCAFKCLGSICKRGGCIKSDVELCTSPFSFDLNVQEPVRVCGVQNYINKWLVWEEACASSMAINWHLHKSGAQIRALKTLTEIHSSIKRCCCNQLKENIPEQLKYLCSDDLHNLTNPLLNLKEKKTTVALAESPRFCLK